MLSPLQSIALMACRVIWRQQLVQATTQATTCLSSNILYHQMLGKVSR
jgi:hypothetical protein